MRKKMRPIFVFVIWLALAIAVAGCSVRLIKRSPADIERIDALSQETAQLQELARLKAEEAQRLRNAYELLQNRLSQELKDRQVKLALDEKGLTITFLAEVLFDSGKSKIRPEAHNALDKVADVIKADLAEQNIGIEGHTDNEPIKYSPWKSNWELSTARAISVLHYLVDEKGISPHLVSATGYGEYRPIASNDIPDGRQKNRRVEIVIIPKYSKSDIAEQTQTKKEEPPQRYYK